MTLRCGRVICNHYIRERMTNDLVQPTRQADRQWNKRDSEQRGIDSYRGFEEGHKKWTNTPLTAVDGVNKEAKTHSRTTLRIMSAPGFPPSSTWGGGEVEEGGNFKYLTILFPVCEKHKNHWTMLSSESCAYLQIPHETTKINDHLISRTIKRQLNSKKC